MTKMCIVSIDQLYKSLHYIKEELIMDIISNITY